MGYDLEIIKKAPSDPLMIQYLQPCYQRIVEPMREDIKTLMIEFRITSESELIQSNLKTLISKENAYDSKRKYKRTVKLDDIAISSEDASAIFDLNKKALISSYKHEFRKLIQEKFDPEDEDTHEGEITQNMAVALYLATYFPLNKHEDKKIIELFSL